MWWSLITKFLDIFYMNICFHSSLPITAARNDIGMMINMKYRLVRPIIFFNIIASCNRNSCYVVQQMVILALDWSGKGIRSGC